MYNQEIKTEVCRLRSKNGLTFKEIRIKFPSLHKSTISNWVRDIELSPEQEKRIFEKQLNRRREFQEYNKRKKLEAETKRNCIIKKAASQIKQLSRRDLIIAGACLYWAEGHKRGRNSIEFVNSDPKMIMLELRFLREILKIPENKFRCGLTLHSGLNVDKVISFWSLLTGISKKSFRKPYIKPPKSRTGKMFNVLYNGTLKVASTYTDKLNEIKGFIKGLEEQS